jgi:phosphatidylserine decarboxylase
MIFAKEAWPFVIPFFALSLVLLGLSQPRWAALALVVGILVLLFFRNPARSFEGPPGTVLAAADGLVTRVDTVEDTDIGAGPFRRVVTFLSVFDVHLQRAPVEGEVVATRFRRGKKVAAFRSHADRVNESHLTVFRRQGGDVVGVRQIAGLLARRVVCYVERGDRIARGDLMGIIKFGSRVDVLVPEGYEVAVKKGDRVKAGETAIASPPSGENW